MRSRRGLTRFGRAFGFTQSLEEVGGLACQSCRPPRIAAPLRDLRYPPPTFGHESTRTGAGRDALALGKQRLGYVEVTLSESDVPEIVEDVGARAGIVETRLENFDVT